MKITYNPARLNNSTVPKQPTSSGAVKGRSPDGHAARFWCSCQPHRGSAVSPRRRCAGACRAASVIMPPCPLMGAANGSEVIIPGVASRVSVGIFRHGLERCPGGCAPVIRHHVGVTVSGIILVPQTIIWRLARRYGMKG